MLAAYRGEQPDRVPVSPEIWDATALEVSGCPFHELIGPFAEVPWWRTHLAAQEHFGCDAWIVVGAGDSSRQREMRRECSAFIDDRTIETEITWQTSLGDLHAIARTTPVYADWLIEHPVVQFPLDMEKYEDCFFDDPATFDFSAIAEAIDGVGDRGLVTPMAGELFTSFLGSLREGGMVQTLYDLTDHRDYCTALRERYLEHISRLTAAIIERTATQAIFVNSNYSGPPIVSPSVYEEWDQPVLAAVVDVCRPRGVPVHLHQHGHTLAVLDQIIDAGVSIVCPLLPPPQGDVADLAVVKRRCAGRIALKGNVDPAAVLLNGTPADVERDVRRCIDSAAGGGGFILGTADSTLVGTPFENIHAFVEAGRKYGAYA